MKQRLYMVHCQGRYGENVYIPYTCGLLWAYARQFPEIADAYEMVDFLYLKEPIDRAVSRLENPDIVAVSHYIWNARWNEAFAREVKRRWPRCTIIVGGVQVHDESPRTLEECEAFDFAIYGEGEGAFADFLREHASPTPDYSICGSLIRRIWGASATDGEHDGLLVGGSYRAADKRMIYVNARRDFVPLEQLRSPYLDGVFDGIWDREPRWQILHETGSRGCPYASFSGDTLIALPDRIVRFDEEQYSSENTLPCPDAEHQHRLGVKDERLVAQGPRECLRIRLSNGLHLTVTPEHPMLRVIDEQIVDAEARDLRPGDWMPIEVGQNKITQYVALEEPSKTKAEILAAQGIGQGRRVPNPINLPKVLDEKVAWLTGYLIGDGCLPTDNRSSVLLAVKDRSRVTLMAVVPDLFGVPLHITDSQFTDKMQHGAVHSRKAVQFFRESLGVQPNEEKLTVPRGIFRSPKTVARAFLDGLYCADGYWPNGKEPYVTTVSEQLAQECAALIHWIGDAAVVRKIKTRSNLKCANIKPWQYRVEWHGDRCRERAGGHPCVLSAVPAVRHTYRDRKGQLCLRHTPQDRNREGSPRSVLRHFEPKHPLLDPRLSYAKVVSVESAGLQETYDVHHHPEHKVAANGVFVRQCTFCAWGQAALNDVRQLPEERVRAEIEWFGQRKVSYIDGTDANFGILKRDIEFAKCLAATKAKYGYPRTFRTSFAKNSNETIWEIACILHEAKMLKSVTLAMQSMDDEVLVNIKRKNIKFNKFEQLIKRYEDAGIPTYTEIILGLPGESLDTFLDGIDKNLEAGQHSGLFTYQNIFLNNTEQSTPLYRDAHGLETRSMQAMLTHGTPDDSVPREVQEVVVGTSAMPHADWKRAYLHGKVVEVFHAQGLLQYVAIKCHERGARYRDFYSLLLDWCLAHPETVAGREICALRDLLDRALAGGSWDCVDERLGEISWPPEEFAFARICLDLEGFYDEVSGFLHAAPPSATEREVDQQRRAITPPAAGCTREWAREVVWYGRKSYSKKLKSGEKGAA